MPQRIHDSDGTWREKATKAAVLDVIRECDRDDPVATTSDVVDILHDRGVDVTTETVRRKLTVLHDDGRVGRKEVGARAVVWYPVYPDPETDP